MKVEFTGVLVALRHLPDWGGLAGAIHAAIFSHQGGAGIRGNRRENPTTLQPFQNLNIFYFERLEITPPI